MYHYEALGDERFQEFCQALISASFPNAQCLPTGQPDGGRDAYAIQRVLLDRSARVTQKELIVFQVKFSKNERDARSEREMIEEVVKLEQKKVDHLKQLGLTKYYLLTNVKGTAHLDSGSIDRVNRQLSEALSIDAYCWWRDDLDRRLDGQSSVKWSYPDVLKATDLLEALVKGSWGEDESRRRAAIRAYMTAQYDDDQELKFKQTELRSTMTELFVDLPMQQSTSTIDPDLPVQDFARVELRQPRFSFAGQTSSAIRSAAYFINSDPRASFSRAVLEGAPGQGKSTVTQYVCQLLRMRLLDKHVELSRLPKQHHATSLRIPFRVDLRDLAKWISGTDPFQSKPVNLDGKEPKSLEGFLAGQVRVISGGHDFSVADLTAVARASHLFLALDGFDEVADVELREQLVLEITKGTTRLINAGGFSVQTIVTSRPAAFAKSIRFPREQWTYFELLPLERSQVDEYAIKWMKAKWLKEIEQAQLMKMLDTKLKEPHTQYLAKNPMQLTILLSLIHNRGASLPEKRTAMYDAYMDMFFSRESEKSDIVRDNRDLLIDIHRFLAWKLQTAAESGENGSIERGLLRTTLFSYLDSQGEDTSIVNDLFDGIIERVGALVSRVQETYEFEVQPLREYFVARYLYETAPYSPAGDEKTGTKLERFDALIRNPYWLNVTRFYGGCFSKGEISALVDELVELAETGPYKLTSHARSVALMLLGDWVFTQYQPAVKRIVALVGEYPQLRQLLANAEEDGASGWSSLPDRSGRSDFLETLWSRIKTKHVDEREALANAISQNSSMAERTNRWKEMGGILPHSDWVWLGANLRILGSGTELSRNVEVPLSPEVIHVLLATGAFEYLEAEHFTPALKQLLGGSVIPFFRFRQSVQDVGRLQALSMIFNLEQYSYALHEDETLPVRYVLETRGLDLSLKGRIPSSLLDDYGTIVRAHDHFLDIPVSETSTSIGPWSALVEELRGSFGDQPVIDRIAFVAAGIRSKLEVGIEGRLEHTINLVETARFVRLKSGAPRWWEERLKAEADPIERRRLLLLLWLWGTRRTVVEVSAVVGEALASLSETDWENLCREFRILRARLRLVDDLGDVEDGQVSRIRRLGSRVCMFVGWRAGAKTRVDLAMAIANGSLETHSPQTNFALESIVSGLGEVVSWKVALPIIKALYARGARIRYPFARNTMGHQAFREARKLSDEDARTISSEPEKYPLPLVAMADAELRSSAGAAASKLLDVAVKERWFGKMAGH